MTGPLGSTDIDAVLAANRAFYAAFASRDFAAMDLLWARDVTACCIHPGWPALTERTRVLASWRDIMRAPQAPDVACRGDRAFLYGDTAIVLCEELIGDAVLAATNLFVREAGSWRLAHHQSGQIAPALARNAPETGAATPGGRPVLH